jgi:hypothetical protein
VRPQRPESLFKISPQRSLLLVVPAKAGTWRLSPVEMQRHWIPAFAGMTSGFFNALEDFNRI